MTIVIEPLISCSELMERINNPEVIVLDGSWYLPNEHRDAQEEFKNQHIVGARFFDIDQISAANSDLPHMLPKPEHFANAIEQLGISNDSQVIVYDGKGLFSAARVWWMFKVFGHESVSVLSGGLCEWLQLGFPTTDQTSEIHRGSFNVDFDADSVASMQDILANLETAHATILDARSLDRFLGLAPEPRPELPSGHMPGAASLPFTDLLDHGKLKPTKDLKSIFHDLGIQHDTRIITSCGSGVTAAVITLALFVCGYGMQRLYDGSWTEWASTTSNPIESET